MKDLASKYKYEYSNQTFFIITKKIIDILHLFTKETKYNLI